MVGPELGRCTLDLRDGGSPLVLWFNNRALYDLSSLLEKGDIAYSDIPQLAQDLKVTNLHLYVWSATAHLKAARPALEQVRDRLLDTPLPPLELYNEVLRALRLGVIGIDPKMAEKEESEEEAEKANRPGTRPAVGSNGGKPSGSPSAISGGTASSSGTPVPQS